MMKDFRFTALIILIGLFLCLPTSISAEEKLSPSVGAEGSIEQIVLPGTELTGKPLVDGAKIVARVVKTFPHGDNFRYDIRFHGFEPGKFDLAKWLVRKDGSSTDDLPEIPVEIKSLLPPGQIEPNDLDSGWLPSLGGYRNLMTLAIFVWTLVFFGLIFLFRKKPEEEVAKEKPASLADLLQTRLESAMANKMDPTQYAELERMLFAFWRKRMKLESVTADQAMKEIKADKDAGPLMLQLEQWMHSPNPDKNVDLAKLVKPFRDLPHDTPGFEV